MKHQEALSEGEVQKSNIKSAKEWIEKNKSKVKAAPNKTLVYSGRDYDLEKLEKNIPDGDRKTFMGTPIFKRIEDMRRRRIQEEIPTEFETIEDVLKKIKSHPVIIDKDRLEKSFAHAWECYMELKHMPKLIPANVVAECWSRLSQVFSANAVGELKILDGVADDYTLLKQDKDFVTKELEALMRNTSLSEAGKKVLREKIGKYGSYFDRRYTDLMRQLDSSKKALKGK